ncbi:MAG TPA: L,D-transpeptidase family protein [Terrimicrobiaceae bacterium]|nr:L,D-transpeptidase family protein [Terrimicrobiaceae bacterium]
MKHLDALRHVAVAILALALGACASYDPRLNDRNTVYLGTGGPVIDPSVKEDLALKKSYWDDSGIAGSPSIVINLTKQTASFYKDAKLVGVSAISSGREGFDTPAGHFKITQKNIDHASNLYGDYVDASGNVVVKDVDVKKDPRPAGATFRGAPMPYFMRITGGVGMHQGFLPGVPDSHGCIRMPQRMARLFWDNAPLGTPVTVVY